MKVVFTAAALADLDELLTYTAVNYPDLAGSVEQRIHAIIERIGIWPEHARKLEQSPDIRMVPVLRYPFKIFYRIADDRVEILHIHHASRDVPNLRNV